MVMSLSMGPSVCSENSVSRRKHFYRVCSPIEEDRHSDLNFANTTMGCMLWSRIDTRMGLGIQFWFF